MLCVTVPLVLWISHCSSFSTFVHCAEMEGDDELFTQDYSTHWRSATKAEKARDSDLKKLVSELRQKKRAQDDVERAGICWISCPPFIAS